MRSKCVLNKNSNSDLRTQIQKLKISKSPFSQTQQYHQILKPHSIKSIQKYNITNPNKKDLKLKTTHQPPRLKQATNLGTIIVTKPTNKSQTKPRSEPPTIATLTQIGTTTQQKLTHETHEFRTNTVAYSQQT